jgi:hypothetical protein
MPGVITKEEAMERLRKEKTGIREDASFKHEEIEQYASTDDGDVNAEEELREFIRKEIKKRGSADPAKVRKVAKSFGISDADVDAILGEEIQGSRNPVSTNPPKIISYDEFRSRILSWNPNADPIRFSEEVYNKLVKNTSTAKTYTTVEQLRKLLEAVSSAWKNVPAVSEEVRTKAAGCRKVVNLCNDARGWTEENWKALCLGWNGLSAAISDFFRKRPRDLRVRVGQGKDGTWRPIMDHGVSQQNSVYSGALYERGSYWITSREDNWIPANADTVKQYLNVERGISTQAPRDGGLNPMKKAMNFIVRNADIEYATQLAGYPKGIYVCDGKRILVTSSPTIIEPAKGEWETIHNFLSQMLGDEQLEFLYGWIKVAYTSLTSGTFTPGQIPVLAGPRDCGKTLMLTRIITPILGGRDAKPYQYMIGKTPFNSDLFKGEHLIISDENPATDMLSRRAFGAAIKNLIVEPKQRMHAKKRDAIMLQPFWRVTIAVNDEPENLMILPPLDHSILDKLMLFHADRPSCLPTDAEEERAKFGAAIRDGLPGFIHYLVNEHKIKPELKSSRFGIKEYHNPDLVRSVEGLSGESHLMEMINQEIFKGGLSCDEWSGTAGDLTSRLKSRDSAVSSEAQKALFNSISVGRMLSRLEKSMGVHQGAVTSRPVNGEKVYTVHRTMRNYGQE